METFLDGPDSAIAARGDDLLPLSHRFPCRARVIATDIATLGACEEVLGGRGEVGEAGVMHGLSQAQGVVRDLYAIDRRGQRACGGSGNQSMTKCRPTQIHIRFLLATALREGAPRSGVCASWGFRIGAPARVVVLAQMRPRHPRRRARLRRLRKRMWSRLARVAIRTDAWARRPFEAALAPRPGRMIMV